MEPTWVLSAPYGPHCGPMNLSSRASKECKLDTRGFHGQRVRSGILRESRKADMYTNNISIIFQVYPCRLGYNGPVVDTSLHTEWIPGLKFDQLKTYVFTPVKGWSWDTFAIFLTQIHHSSPTKS